MRGSAYVKTNVSKRALQRFVLGRILRHPHNKKPMTVVCMPGASCWDVKYFASFSRVEKIIAVEREPDVAKQIEAKIKKLPQVELYNGSITKFLDTYKQGVDLLYLDYCSNLNIRVLHDLHLIFRNQILPIGGKCVVNFFGAREAEDDWIAMRRHFDDLAERVSPGCEWDSFKADQKRCIAFNSLIASFRFTPLRPLPVGHTERLYCTTTAPLWHRYATVGGSMLTGYFGINTYGRRVNMGAVQLTPDCWYVRGQWSIKDFKRTNLTGISKTEGKQAVRDEYKKKILNFYERHHYTPTSKEIGHKNIRGFREIIREIGLCPRSGATLDEVKAEILRIYQRHGIVRWSDLKKAHLTKRRAFGYKSALARLLNEMNLTHAVRSEKTKRKNVRRYERLIAYVNHLEDKKKKTEFPYYSWVNKNHLLSYKDVLAELRRMETQGEVEHGHNQRNLTAKQVRQNTKQIEAPGTNKDCL